MRSPLMPGKSRIEVLNDGVFSITMTLFVLKLRIPPLRHFIFNNLQPIFTGSAGGRLYSRNACILFVAGQDTTAPPLACPHPINR
jgi:hypothetical protein